ncbi:MAG: 3-hydroxyacyl-CoA dehydrogenase NAD-binding domain-containing protein, partial [Verrucomicrobiota bacterium]
TKLQHLVTPITGRVPMHNRDIIIEAAVENLATKKKIFTELAEHSRPDTILATNTSALSITELASTIPHPERVVGLHFFNPVHRMKLVEIIYTDHTSAEVKQACLDHVRKLGKSPVLVKDSPGFLVNRILMPYLIEAGRLLEMGVAPTAIDNALLSFGMPVGPIRLLDDIGLDVALHVAETMEVSYPDRMQVPTLLKTMVEKGYLGRKSGKGISDFDHPKVLPMDADEIRDRLVLLMVAEAFRCLEEKIVQSPDELDFAMILGTGWAPFRGGPMQYAADRGMTEVHNRLREFFESDGVIYCTPQSLN